MPKMEDLVGVYARYLRETQPENQNAFDPVVFGIREAVDAGLWYMARALMHDDSMVGKEEHAFSVIAAALEDFFMVRHNPLSQFFKQHAYMTWGYAGLLGFRLSISDQSINPDSRNTIAVLTEDDFRLWFGQEEGLITLSKAAVTAAVTAAIRHISLIVRDHYLENPSDLDD